MVAPLGARIAQPDEQLIRRQHGWMILRRGFLRQRRAFNQGSRILQFEHQRKSNNKTTDDL